MYFPGLRRFGFNVGTGNYDWWLLTVLPAVIAIAVIFFLMAVLLMPTAVEKRERLDQQFRQNRNVDTVYEGGGGR